jgi:hypothetical protein
MVSASRKHLFRIGHAQHVRPRVFPPRHYRGMVLLYIYMHRIVMQQAVIKCCRSYVSRLPLSDHDHCSPSAHRVLWTASRPWPGSFRSEPNGFCFLSCASVLPRATNLKC